jgi:thioesterase domain-containing protein
MDSRAPGWSEFMMEYDELSLLYGFMADFAAASGKQFSIPSDSFHGISGEALFDRLLAQAVADAAVPQGVNQEIMLRLFRIYKNNLFILKNYLPGKYEGKAVLLKALDSPDSAMDLGWKKFMELLEMQSLPGNHYSIMRAPQVEHLTGCLVPAAARTRVDAFRAEGLAGLPLFATIEEARTHVQ